VIDRIYADFLDQQHREAAELTAQSDLVKIEPDHSSAFDLRDAFIQGLLTRGRRTAPRAPQLATPTAGDAPPSRYKIHLFCNGLVQMRDGTVAPANRFVVGVSLPPDYLRCAEAPRTLSLLEPVGAFHPNVAFPFICLDLAPGTGIVAIAYALFALFSYQKVQLNHGLNPVAAAYARQEKHRKRFPIDRRPLKRGGGPAIPAEGGGR